MRMCCCTGYLANPGGQCCMDLRYGPTVTTPNAEPFVGYPTFPLSMYTCVCGTVIQTDAATLVSAIEEHNRVCPGSTPSDFVAARKEPLAAGGLQDKETRPEEAGDSGGVRGAGEPE